MAKKDVYSIIIEETYQHFKDIKTFQKDILDYSEKFLVWIIGFSIGGITLLVNDISKSERLFGNRSVDWAVVLLGISIICGITFRYVVAYNLYHITEVMFRVQLKLKNIDLPPLNEALDLSNTNIHGIVGILEMYGKDYKYLIDGFDKLKQEEQEHIYTLLIAEYKKTVDDVHEDLKDAQDYISETIKKEFDYSDSKMEKIANVNHGKKLQQYEKVYKLSFRYCLLSFIASLVLLIVSYLFMN